MTSPGATTPPADHRRVAIVTGAASGIGRATVRRLVGAQHVVVGIDRQLPTDPEDVDRDITWIVGDVTVDATWDRAIAAAQGLSGDGSGADALISCAGIISVLPFLDTPLDTWRRVLDVNVLGAVLGLQRTLPGMRSRGSGAVVVVCSVDSFFSEELMSAYATSKAALLQATRGAALEHARDGIQINAVCPGAVDTPLLSEHLGSVGEPAALRDETAARTPVGRLIDPADVAEVIAFLIGDGARGMSGAAVTVDGGLSTALDYPGPSRAEGVSAVLR